MFRYEAEQARDKIVNGEICLKLKAGAWRPDTLIDRAALQLLDIRLPNKKAYPGIEDDILKLCENKCFVDFSDYPA